MATLNQFIHKYKFKHKLFNLTVLAWIRLTKYLSPDKSQILLLLRRDRFSINILQKLNQQNQTLFHFTGLHYYPNRMIFLMILVAFRWIRPWLTGLFPQVRQKWLSVVAFWNRHVSQEKSQWHTIQPSVSTAGHCSIQLENPFPQ